MKVLIVEDNPILRDNLAYLLKKSMYLAEQAIHGEDALEKISINKYDAIILDVNMPVMDGKEFLKEMRAKGKITPVIALTSDAMLADKIEMFDLGVDDYVTKPFEIEELLVRLRSVLKRSEKQIDTEVEIGNIRINYSRNKVYQSGKEITFPHKEYLIIEFLAKNRGYPQSKVKIMEYVWGEQEENLELASTTLETHVYAIRKKLGKDFIRTQKGCGYIIE